MPISDWTPSVEDIGSILRARTKDRNGNEIGTFNADTRPTAAGVQEQIDLAMGKISPLYREDISESTFSPAIRAAALKAAMLVELSYFPEQVATGQSPYDQLKDQYAEAWEDLQTAIGTSDDSDGDPGELGESGFPNYAFPEDVGGLVDWGTRF